MIFGDSRLANRLADKARTDTAVSTCVIVRGELIYMAEKSEQRQSNLMEVESWGVVTVVSEDNDFQRMRAASALQVEDWLS